MLIGSAHKERCPSHVLNLRRIIEMNRRLFSVMSMVVLAGVLIVPVSATMNHAPIGDADSSIENASAAPANVFLPATGTVKPNGYLQKIDRYRYILSITAKNNTGSYIPGGTKIFWSVGDASGQMTIGDDGTWWINDGDSFVVKKGTIVIDGTIPPGSPFSVWFVK